MSFEYVSNSTCSTLQREHEILFPWLNKELKGTISYWKNGKYQSKKLWKGLWNYAGAR